MGQVWDREGKREGRRRDEGGEVEKSEMGEGG